MAEQADGYASIEELRERHGTPDAVFEGVKAANGWKAGKMATEAAFLEAVEAFGMAPMDGREVRESV